MFGYRNKEDDKVNKETITLYDLKFENKYKYYEKKEDLKNKEENLSKNKFYKIDDKKKEELEKVFKQVKTKIKLSFNLTKSSYSQDTSITIPEIIYDKKTIENKNLCLIYDQKNFSKILEIEIAAPFLFVEKLENKDYVFLTSNENNNELLIYRSMQGQNDKNKGYILTQKIKETFEGYEIKYNYEMNMFGEEEKTHSKEYNLYYIKAISGNRFFCVSNYGFKMYALNEKNEYELVLLEPYEKIDFIYEIDTDQFIFGLNIRKVEGYGFCGNAYTCYYRLLLNIIELKDIDKKQNKSKNNNLKMKEKLKFSVISKTMFEFNFSVSLVFDIKVEFSDFVTLKNKYFIVMIQKSIIIFNMETKKEIKKFEINIDGHPYFRSDIKKWDCPENDEFILILNNNVILFKLIEEKSNEINLSILNYGYFPDLCLKITENIRIYKNLKKINGQKNRFYSYNCKLNDIIIY